MSRKIRQIFSAVATLVVMALFGCGGGGATSGSATISGVAAKGPISGGDVKVYGIKNGQVDTSVVLGSGKTSADGSGSYTVTLSPVPSGPVVVEVGGGTYTDEASGTAGVTLITPLRAAVSSVADGDKIAVTPLTHLAVDQVDGIGAFTTTNINDSNAQIARFFALDDIIKALPFDPTQPAPAGATNEQKKYAAVLGVFSQMVNDDRQKKGNTQSMSEALDSFLLQMATELEINGGFSDATLALVNTAISNFSNGGKNRGGIIPAPIVFTIGVLQLRTDGVLPANTVINGIDCTVSLPAGVTVKSNPATGETPPGVVDPVSLAAVGSVVSAKYDNVAGTVRIILINVQPGFAIGEFAHLEFEGYPVGSANFAVKVNRIDGGSGTSSAPLNGIAVKGHFAGL
jgi:hypothetical protein